MRRTLVFMCSLVLSGAGLAGCALLTVPDTGGTWADARIAEDPDRQAPAFVPDIPRPAVESWRMATAARELADTRDVVMSRAMLIQLPPVDPLVFGQQAREQATPPRAPSRRN